MKHFHISICLFIFQFFLLQQIHVGNDRSQRCFQVMGNICDQFCLHTFPFYRIIHRIFESFLNIRHVFRKIQKRRRNFIQIQRIREVALGTFFCRNHDLFQRTQSTDEQIHTECIEQYKNNTKQHAHSHMTIHRCQNHSPHDGTVAQTIAQHNNDHPAAECFPCKQFTHSADRSRDPCITEKTAVFHLSGNRKDITQTNAQCRQIHCPQNGSEHITPELHCTCHDDIQKCRCRYGTSQSIQNNQQEMDFIVNTVYL